MKQVKRLSSQSTRRHLATKRSHKKVMARSRKFYLQTQVIQILDVVHT
ncbi:hypothetical protein [Corallincola spongiicola]|nr:hypothetical protein [Corallincola spongiicola]